MKLEIILKKIWKPVLPLMVCALILSFPGKVYAEDTSNTNNSNNTGQTLYDALSRIYGNSTNNGNGSNTGNNTGSNTGNSTGTGSGSNTNQNQTSVVDQIMQGMESEVKGPEVSEGGLSEYYHQNYKVYEESLNDDVSVFTNVANGSVVNRPVVLDIPEGVAYRMKRDGKVVEVASEEPITEPGSYVLTLYVLSEDQDNIPFSQQKISKSKFRFRIQYETGVAGFDAIEGETVPESLSVSSNIPGVGIPGLPSLSSNEANSVSENNSLLFGEGDDEYLPDDLRPDDYDYSFSPTVSGNAPDAGNDLTPEDGKTTPEEAFLAANGMNGVYDPDSGYYKNTLLTKDYFYTNVPNGMLTNEPVMIQAAGNLIYTVYKDGEVLEGYEPGEYLRDGGSYTVIVSGKNESFTSVYGDRLPVFHFRIISDPVSDLGVLNAPENMTFRSVRFEGEDISQKAVMRPDTVRLIEDGTYEITMDSGYGSTELSVALDTVQPIFSVSVEPNLATITYKTNDIDHCVLYKNGELASNTGIVKELTEAGEYTLTAYDKAGNKSEAVFRVSYRINSGAVFAILIVLALIGGGVFYLLRIRKKVSIR